MKRQKDEKITGAKFILDELVFFLNGIQVNDE